MFSTGVFKSAQMVGSDKFCTLIQHCLKLLQKGIGRLADHATCWWIMTTIYSGAAKMSLNLHFRVKKHLKSHGSRKMVKDVTNRDSAIALGATTLKCILLPSKRICDNAIDHRDPERQTRPASISTTK